MRPTAEQASAGVDTGILVIMVGKLFMADSIIFSFSMHRTTAVSHKLSFAGGGLFSSSCSSVVGALCPTLRNHCWNRLTLA